MNRLCEDKNPLRASGSKFSRGDSQCFFLAGYHLDVFNSIYDIFRCEQAESKRAEIWFVDALAGNTL